MSEAKILFVGLQHLPGEDAAGVMQAQCKCRCKEEPTEIRVDRVLLVSNFLAVDMGMGMQMQMQEQEQRES